MAIFTGYPFFRLRFFLIVAVVLILVLSKILFPKEYEKYRKSNQVLFKIILALIFVGFLLYLYMSN